MRSEFTPLLRDRVPTIFELVGWVASDLMEDLRDVRAAPNTLQLRAEVRYLVLPTWRSSVFCSDHAACAPGCKQASCFEGAEGCTGKVRLSDIST